MRDGYHGELDEMRALRDKSRRVIAGLQARICRGDRRQVAEDPAQQRARLFHRGDRQQCSALTGGGGAGPRFIHRQTLASAMRFTTTELADLETKIANAADRALAIEQEIFDTLAASRRRSGRSDQRRRSQALAVIDVSAAPGACSPRNRAIAGPWSTTSLAFEIVAGRHPVVEQALRRQAAEPFVANDCDCRRAMMAGRVRSGS